MLTLDKLTRAIKTARKAKNYSQTELGKRADVSRSQIDRLENGRVSDVSLSTLMRILRALDLDLTLGPHNYGRPTLTELRNND